MKVARLSALHTGRLYPRKYSWYSSLSQPQGHSAAGRIMSMKNSNDTIGNLSRDFPVCSAVPQPLRHGVPQQWNNEFKYLGTTLTNQNSIQEEIKNRLKSENACYHSVQILLSSSLLSKNLKIKIYRTIILPVALYGVNRHARPH
jgi:hypothetical protein